MRHLAWKPSEVLEILRTPLLELIYRAASVHNEFHVPNEVQISGLISIKTGHCPEDCAYCPQSARYASKIESHELMSPEEIISKARELKSNGASRICLGAAWRNVTSGKQFDHVCDAVREVAAMGVEVCCTLGMLTEQQAQSLERAGLYAYNHNIDTSEEYYPNIISTRTFSDRLNTLANIRKTNVTLCCGGIVGMGETEGDRASMLSTLASLTPPPESVPINALVPTEGTPLGNVRKIDPLEIARVIATARIIMPKSVIRLSAGRMDMSFSEQGLCFLAGANSIFSGDKLLTTPNPTFKSDADLFRTLGLKRKVLDSPETPVTEPSNSVLKIMERRLNKLKTQNKFRILPTEKNLVDFSSNDYLGLSQEGSVSKAVNECQSGQFSERFGATGSRLLNGNSKAILLLEEKIRECHNSPTALLFNSGYDANLGLISCLPKDDSQILYDENVHVSIKDGVKLSGTLSYPFRHNDLNHLEDRLKRASKSSFVIVESLYSMDGDFSPLREIANLCLKYGANLVVDEAHTGGIFGKSGAGLVEHLNLSDQVFARIITYGKAFGCQGASVLGSPILKDYLINFSHPFIYTTAPSSVSVRAVTHAYELMVDDSRRNKLHNNIRLFSNELEKNHSLMVRGDPFSPIRWIPIPEDTQPSSTDFFESKGLDVRLIRSPTVKRGTERMRVVMHSFNSTEEILKLLDAMKSIL